MPLYDPRSLRAYGVPSAQEEALDAPDIEPGDMRQSVVFGASVLKSLASSLPLLGMAAYPASRIALNPADMNPKRFMTVHPSHKSFDEQGYPASVPVHITFPHSSLDDTPGLREYMQSRGMGVPGRHADEVKGLNRGHALRRAADNWPDAERVQIIGPPTRYSKGKSGE